MDAITASLAPYVGGANIRLDVSSGKTVIGQVLHADDDTVVVRSVPKSAEGEAMHVTLRTDDIIAVMVFEGLVQSP